MGFSDEYQDLSNAITLGAAMKEASNYKSTGAIPQKPGEGSIYLGPSGHLGGPLEPLGEINSEHQPAPRDFLTRKFRNFVYANDRPSFAKGWKFAALTKDQWVDLFLKIWILIIIVGLVMIVYLALKGRL